MSQIGFTPPPLSSDPINQAGGVPSQNQVGNAGNKTVQENHSPETGNTITGNNTQTMMTSACTTKSRSISRLSMSGKHTGFNHIKGFFQAFKDTVSAKIQNHKAKKQENSGVEDENSHGTPIASDEPTIKESEKKTFDLETEKQKVLNDSSFTDDEKSMILGQSNLSVKNILKAKISLKVSESLTGSMHLFSENQLDELYTFITTGKRSNDEIQEEIGRLLGSGSGKNSEEELSLAVKTKLTNINLGKFKIDNIYKQVPEKIKRMSKNLSNSTSQNNLKAFGVCCMCISNNNDGKNLEKFLKDLETCAKRKELCQMNKDKAEIQVDAFMKLVQKHNINLDKTKISNLH